MLHYLPTYRSWPLENAPFSSWINPLLKIWWWLCVRNNIESQIRAGNVYILSLAIAMEYQRKWAEVATSAVGGSPDFLKVRCRFSVISEACRVPVVTLWLLDSVPTVWVWKSPDCSTVGPKLFFDTFYYLISPQENSVLHRNPKLLTTVFWPQYFYIRPIISLQMSLGKWGEIIKFNHINFI